MAADDASPSSASNRPTSRRNFLRWSAASAVAAGLAPAAMASADEVETLAPRSRAAGTEAASVAPNDRVRLATIGMGIIGFVDTETALQVPGVEFVAAADCYDGRRRRTKEVFGSDVDTTGDYRAILDRSDVDAVIVATPDHWHQQITVEALEAGKAVYCEKPMVQKVEQAREVLEAEEQSGQVLQVGSQYVSDVVYEKAAELLEDGAIGELNVVQASINRISALGAWNYSIPPDASTETCDWDRFVGPAPDRPFDADRFFRWRKYWDYGTGIPGDLFVHRFSGLHRVTGSTGPETIWATGGLRHWNDGREAPDVMLGLYDYPETEAHPEFTFALQVSLAAGGGASPDFVFIGDAGAITIRGDEVSLSRNAPSEPSIQGLMEGYNSARTFAKEQREELEEQYRAYMDVPRSEAAEEQIGVSTTYQAPEGYNNRLDHFRNFIAAIRGQADPIEPGSFGLRAAAPALLSNRTYREEELVAWDPNGMELVT